MLEKLTVLKPFPHPTRRFSVGDTVTEVDLIGCSISTPELKKGKFLAGADTAAAEKAVAKAEDKPYEGEPLAIPEGATQAQQEQAVIENGMARNPRR